MENQTKVILFENQLKLKTFKLEFCASKKTPNIPTLFFQYPACTNVMISTPDCNFFHFYRDDFK